MFMKKKPEKEEQTKQKEFEVGDMVYTPISNYPGTIKEICQRHHQGSVGWHGGSAGDRASEHR